MQEAVALLAAASPYMEPPERLRTAILAATAPSTFKIEDYRRASDNRSNRYLWWGMAAAVLCLLWSGYDVMNLRKDNAQLAGQTQQQKQQLILQNQQLANVQKAVRQLTDPNIKQITLRSGTDQKVIGKLLVDSRTNEIMVVMPDAVIPPNTKVKMTLQQNGHTMEIAADAIGAAPGSAFVHWKLPQAIDPNQPLNINVNDGPRIAGFK